jgi:undecaprenyl pyrophosphate phosphatase UppP
MQQTRLNTLVNRIGAQAQNQLRNPWRRLATLVIALLFGVLFGIAVSATAGQLAYLDVTVAAILVLGAEAISWLHYRDRKQSARPLWNEALNAFKLGVIYGLFLIAFMLGS